VEDLKDLCLIKGTLEAAKESGKYSWLARYAWTLRVARLTGFLFNGSGDFHSRSGGVK
jgi:hypothetical protein